MRPTSNVSYASQSTVVSAAAKPEHRPCGYLTLLSGSGGRGGIRFRWSLGAHGAGRRCDSATRSGNLKHTPLTPHRVLVSMRFARGSADSGGQYGQSNPRRRAFQRMGASGCPGSAEASRAGAAAGRASAARQDRGAGSRVRSHLGRFRSVSQGLIAVQAVDDRSVLTRRGAFSSAVG